MGQEGAKCNKFEVTKLDVYVHNNFRITITLSFKLPHKTSLEKL